MRFRARLALATALLGAAMAGSATAQPASDVSAVDGGALYARDCLACHMVDGRGVPGMNPSLVDSAWVTGSPDALAGFILTGGYGPEVRMSPFDYLSDAELAALMSYIRAELAGIEEAPIMPSLVERMRIQIQ